MTQPIQNLRDRSHRLSRGQTGPVDQNHRQAKPARGNQFGLGAGAARILGYDMRDVMGTQQGLVAFGREWAARDHGLRIRQGQGAFGRIDQPQQIMVLRLGGEGCKMLLADRQKHPGGQIGQGGDGGFQIGHMLPMVPGTCLPGRTFQPQKRYFRLYAGGNRIFAHPGGKGMRGVDHMADRLGAQIVDQPGHTAKPADPRWQRLGDGGCGSACIGKHRIEPGRVHRTRQLACFGRAAQDEESRHV